MHNKCFGLFNKYCISSIIRKKYFHFPKQFATLKPSRKTDLDFCDGFGQENPIYMTELHTTDYIVKVLLKRWLRGYKNLMLNSAEHEIFPAHKY